ncbi:alpha-2-macroglobulin [Pedobacter sp. SYSU D00535]|uniref:alpha-2-macroglobulin family protein n=1 Tax=Pedobacter sp. SYSU D00535 TaxID=2810308 RepID=UPI001A96B427|nr:MG2 domain-containing protein [Pedobacter sp. SYSU D00535]
MIPEIRAFFASGKNVALILLVSLAVIAVVGRKTNQKRHETGNYELFASYVENYTSGIVSRESNIRVRLAVDVPTLSAANEAVDPALFDISPAVKGKAFWLDSRTIEFRPDTSLSPNQLYSVSLKLNRLMKLPETLGEFRFDFQTIKPDYSVETLGLRSSSNSSKDKMTFTGIITTADKEDADKIEKLISVKYDGNSITRWEHQTENRTHTFTITNIIRYKTGKNLEVKWNGEPIDVDGGGNEEQEVPAYNEFKVLAIRAIQGKEQYVSILFSDPIRIGQELTGLLGISNHEMPAYTINGSEVKLYPNEKLDGNYTAFVNEGIENFEGKKLSRSFSGNVFFQNTDPAVSIPGKGVILPHSGRLMMPFEAVNLNAVDVTIIKIYRSNIPQYLQENSIDGQNQLRQVAKPVKQVTIKLDDDKSLNLHKKNRFMLDIDKLIRTEPGAVYRITIGFRPSYSIYTCKERQLENGSGEDSEEDSDYDDGLSIDEDDEFWKRYDNYYPYGYNWDERDNPCSNSYYNKERWASRNVLASNIGLIAKQGSSNNLTIAVTDILSAEPMGGVELELLDYQQQIIGKILSGSNGIAEISLKRKPYLLVAKKGEERGYLKLDDGSSLPLSRFNVGGAQVQRGLKGFIYGERGVWRPGDCLFLTFILDDKQNKLPKGHPVDFELYTPQGQLFKQLSRTENVNGFYQFKTATDASSPTGNWTAKVKAGGAEFEKRIRIETIMPNRLKINLAFANPNQLTKNENAKGLLEAKWLFGGAARKLNAKIDAYVSSEPTTFPKLEQYTFDDPIRPFNSQLQNIFDGKLDENGQAKFDANINVEGQAPGRLTANFMVKVFEPGGNFSINQVSMPYNVYDGYVGIQTPKGTGYNEMLVTGINHPIQIVAVDANGTLQRGNRSVEVELYKMKWQWWWDEDETSVSNFSQDEYNKLVYTSSIELKDGKGIWNMRIDQPEWGRFLLRVRDPKTGHTTGKIVYVDWPNWSERMQNENPTEAAMLSFTANREKFKVGEEAVLTIPTGNAGRGLVSVENGSRVLKTFWFAAKKGQTQVRFTIDKSMSPNVFVNVTLLQPHSQTVNDLPIRMYGVIPLEVEDPSTVLQPVISMPSEIKPETSTSITVSEAAGKPMTYTIAIVDEGLLDITNFNTPDPHKTFYAREGLGVKTWDLFDYVIGAYGGDLQRILSIGGDRQSGKGKNPTANRFKPVVKFLGPFTSNGGKKTHTFKLPQYVGSVRVMVIAGQNGAYGQAEKAVKVKKPLMVLATLPRVLAPGEQVRLPVTVFAMSNAIKNVSLEVHSAAFHYSAGNKRTLSFTRAGDQLVYLDLLTKNFEGIGKVKVIARSGKETAAYDVELDIRNPSPVLTHVIEKTLEPGGTVSLPFSTFGTPGTNRVSVEVSSIPALNLGKRLNYLIQYPHGCVEQITSSAFPQLYLSKIVDLSEGRKAQVERNIRVAIARLAGYQLSDGGMGYWPGVSEADEWSTNYVGHFMLEAESAGFAPAPGFLSQWMKFQKSKAVSWTPTTLNFYGGDLLQAYRLYLLALGKSPELGAMNRLKEFRYLSVQARWRLAAAYRLSGHQEAARQLIRGLSFDVKPYTQSYGTFGSELRDEAMILETVTLLGMRKPADDLLRSIAARLSRDSWYSTQETAYALIAVAKYCGTNNQGKKLQFTYRLNNQQSKVDINARLWQQALQNPLAKNSSQISNKGKNRLFVRVIVQGKPGVGQAVSSINNPNVLGMRVGYFSMSGELIDPAKLIQGTDFVAQVNITNPGKRGNYHNLALSQLFPSGWEIINTRLMNNEGAFQSSPSDYRDIRDDRVNTYFSLPAGKEVTYFVLLNASYIGKYYLPPSTCEGMYNANISASSPGKWVEVVDPAVPITANIK